MSRGLCGLERPVSRPDVRPGRARRGSCSASRATRPDFVRPPIGRTQAQQEQVPPGLVTGRLTRRQPVRRPSSQAKHTIRHHPAARIFNNKPTLSQFHHNQLTTQQLTRTRPPRYHVLLKMIHRGDTPAAAEFCPPSPVDEHAISRANCRIGPTGVKWTTDCSDTVFKQLRLRLHAGNEAEANQRRSTDPTRAVSLPGVGSWLSASARAS